MCNFIYLFIIIHAHLGKLITNILQRHPDDISCRLLNSTYKLFLEVEKPLGYIVEQQNKGWFLKGFYFIKGFLVHPYI